MLAEGVFLDRETVDSGDIDFRSLETVSATWRWHPYTPPEETARRTASAEVVVTNKCRIDGPIMEAAERLRLITLVATGTDNVDLAAAADLGIAVCNIRNYATAAVAQHTITLILNLLTGQPWYLQRVKRGEWSRARQFCLSDRLIRQAAGLRLGIVGHGVLGEAVSELGRGLGFEVMLAERRGRAPRPGRLPFETVVEEADVISIHCPLTDETRGLIDRSVMERMKSDALLINTARGGIVEESDLAHCLKHGVIGGAAVDTLSIEPPPPDHPLLDPGIPNLLVTPHNAWASRAARQAAVDQAARVIEAFDAGAPINRVA